jgi:hypothetical protein
MEMTEWKYSISRMLQALVFASHNVYCYQMFYCNNVIVFELETRADDRGQWNMSTRSFPQQQIISFRFAVCLQVPVANEDISFLRCSAMAPLDQILKAPSSLNDQVLICPPGTLVFCCDTRQHFSWFQERNSFFGKRP